MTADPESAASGQFACRLCGAACQGPFTAREMMLGRRDRFDYYACDGCGALQIAAYPANLGDYYPKTYYSLSHGRRSGRLRRVSRWLRRRRAAHELGGLDPVGAVLTRLRGPRECYQWFRFAKLGFASSILDVGCGDGVLLRMLREDGFTALEGVDPFTPEQDRVQDGFVIRSSLAEVTRPVDLILLDDSMEHMPDQPGVLAALRKICGPSTWVCLSLPVVGQAWRTYRTDWVQLDPPRHFYLHTERSVELLARRAGLTVAAVHYDSTAFQFWGSEQYRRDVPLQDQRSHALGSSGGLFAPEQLRDWERQAQELNRARDGDHATFFLRVAPGSAA